MSDNTSHYIPEKLIKDGTQAGFFLLCVKIVVHGQIKHDLNVKKKIIIIMLPLICCFQ